MRRGQKSSKNFGPKKASRKSLRPIIPGWSFDYPLSPQDRAVWDYLWHCAGTKDHCWPSVPTIARACMIHRDTVADSINRLEAMKLIVRRRTGRSNTYHLLLPSAETEGHQIAETEGYQIAEVEGDQMAETEGDKGYEGTKPRNTVVENNSVSGCENDRTKGTARGAQNPGACAPDSAPSQAADPRASDRWTDWRGDDVGEPPPDTWTDVQGSPAWRDLAPWEQRGIVDGIAGAVASSRRWAAVWSWSQNVTSEPDGLPPPDGWRERAAPCYRSREHWRALTPAEQEEVSRQVLAA